MPDIYALSYPTAIMRSRSAVIDDTKRKLKQEIASAPRLIDGAFKFLPLDNEPTGPELIALDNLAEERFIRSYDYIEESSPPGLLIQTFR